VVRREDALYSLGLRVAGDDEAKGLLSVGGARPLDLEPAGFDAIGVFASDQAGSFKGFEFRFESFFLRLPNILVFVEVLIGILW